MDGAIKIINK